MRIGWSRARRGRLENLLDGGSDPNDPVAPLLGSARAPASADEVAGLDTALAAFRSFDGAAGATEGLASASGVGVGAPRSSAGSPPQR